MLCNNILISISIYFICFLSFPIKSEIFGFRIKNLVFPSLFIQKKQESVVNDATFIDKTHSLCSTRLIKNKKLTEELLLKKEDFKVFAYTTEDEVLLKGYKKIHKEAAYNLVFFAGIMGRPTDNAPFFEIFEKNPKYNFFFFSSRNLQSSWYWHPQIVQLGMNGTKDALAGLRYVASESDLPTVAIGLCTGGVNLANAIHLLQKNNEPYPACLIFDSGFASPQKTVKTALQAMTCKWLDRTCGWNGHYTQRRPFWFNALLIGTQSFLGVFADYVLGFWTKMAEQSAGLSAKIKEIDIPILFIHNAGDTITPIEQAIQLFLNAPRAEFWCISEKIAKTNHSVNQFIQQKTYKVRCEEFIGKNVFGLNENSI